jgi:hypothetical protein
MGEQAPLVVYVKDGQAHHLPQRNHDGKHLAQLVESGKGIIASEPIPYPVNKYTIYWEYIKMNAAKERVVFGRLRRMIEKWDPESPILTRIIRPYFTDASKFTYK